MKEKKKKNENQNNKYQREEKKSVSGVHCQMWKRERDMIRKQRQYFLRNVWLGFSVAVAAIPLTKLGSDRPEEKWTIQ